MPNETVTDAEIADALEVHARLKRMVGTVPDQDLVERYARALQEARADNAELREAHERTLAYARKTKESRDVHSVEEVLDLIPQLRAQLAAAEQRNHFMSASDAQNEDLARHYKEQRDRAEAAGAELIGRIDVLEAQAKIDAALAESEPDTDKAMTSEQLAELLPNIAKEVSD